MICMYNIESNYEQIYEEMVKNWKNIVTNDGITLTLDPNEFYTEMQIERVRAISIIESGILCIPTLASLFEPGIANYFVINDVAEGTVCEKCGSTGAVVLLLDKDYLNNLEDKVFVPSYESYYVRGISPWSLDFKKMFPVPVNPETDYWYCPYCNELHRFSYDEDFGLCYEQKVVKAKIDKERYEKKKKAAMQSSLFINLAKGIIL